MAIIREYNPRTDKRSVIVLIEELQDSERDFDSRMPAGSEVSKVYFAWMIRRCRKYYGKIFVAEEGGIVVGFITVLGRMRYTDPDDYPHDYALIEDLIVNTIYRGKGFGRKLLSRAEEHARAAGVSSLQLEVTAANSKARNLYARAGFQEAWIELEKKLGDTKCK